MTRSPFEAIATRIVNAESDFEVVPLGDGEHHDLADEG